MTHPRPRDLAEFDAVAVALEAHAAAVMVEDVTGHSEWLAQARRKQGTAAARFIAAYDALIAARTIGGPIDRQYQQSAAMDEALAGYEQVRHHTVGAGDAVAGGAIPYKRDRLTTILLDHQRTDTGCTCGHSAWGGGFSDHIANEYEATWRTP